MIRLCLKIHTIDITFSRSIVSQDVTELRPFNNTVSIATHTTEKGPKKKKSSREGRKKESKLVTNVVTRKCVTALWHPHSHVSSLCGVHLRKLLQISQRYTLLSNCTDWGWLKSSFLFNSGGSPAAQKNVGLTLKTRM